MYQLKRFVFENVKNLLPNSINNIIAHNNKKASLVFGNNYVKHLKDLKNGSKGIDTEKLLLKTVNNAIKNVPYYRNLYKGKVIDSIETFKNTIEPIDKNVVLINFNDFIADNIDLNRFDYVTTSGTSGIPLRMYLPKDRFSIEIATLHHYWSKIGYDFSKRAVIRMGQFSQKKQIEINPVSKEYIFDGYRLNDTYLLEIYNNIKKYRIEFLHGYPSNLYIFGKFLIKHKLDYSFIKGMFSSSEQVSPHMYVFFSDILKIPFVDFYGHTEKLIFAATNGITSEYYVDALYGYTEILDSENNDSVEGELVGTTLYNTGMPLIRYKTGDEAFLSNKSTKDDIKYGCLILKEIKGRSNNSKIYYKNGDFVTATALVLHGEIYKKIDGLQYFQKEKGKLEIRVIKNKCFDHQTETDLKEIFNSKFIHKLDYNIVYVNKVQRTANGKVLLLISKVK
jgi:phenylacetate-CoA ligase